MNLLIDARRPLLAGLLEYSVLVGSNSPSLAEAVTSYREAVTGPNGWIIGRFLCPTSRLEDLAALLTVSMKPGERPWLIGAVTDEPLGPAAMHASVFNTYMDPAGTIASLETAAGVNVTDDAIVTAASGVSPAISAFIRLDDSAGKQDLVRLADTTRSRVQPVGGLVDMSADRDQLAVIIHESVRLGLPLRLISVLPLSEDLRFLRLFVAAALAHRGAATGRVTDVLTDDGPGAITATAVGLRWRNELFGVPDINNARTTVQSVTGSDLGAAIEAFSQNGMLS